MRSTVWLLVLLGACKDPPPPPPPPPVYLTDVQKAEVHRLIDEAQARVKAAEKTRDGAFASPGTIAVRPCPIGKKDLGIPDDVMPNQLTVKLLGMTRVITPDAAPERRVGVTSLHLETEASMLKMKLDEELKYGLTAESLLADAKRNLSLEVPAFELALVLETFADPKLTGDKSFEGGYTRGMLYLYSEAARAVICAAEVRAESADEVTTHTLRETSEADRRSFASAHLTGALIVSTIDHGLRTLHAVDPRGR